MVKLLVLSVLGSVSAEMSWEDFKNFYGKVYNDVDEDSGEDSTRQQVFNANIKKIRDHNANNETWTMAVNVFADLDRDEFVAMVSDKQPQNVDEVPTYDELHASDAVEVQSSIDWTQRGVVNAVQNQGNANSCWAHSAAAALESAYAIATTTLVKLSEQQLCDCSNAGTCRNGGDEQDALPWYETHGACSRSSYAYTGSDSSCKSCDVVVPAGTVTGLSLVPSTVQDWKTALNKNPITTGISPGQLQFYSSGVVSGNSIVTAGCDGGGGQHAVVAVGYGTDSLDYFKIRNSYGPSWGEQGYVRVAQVNSNSRGTACIFQYKASYPTISAKPSPSPTPSPTRRRSPSPSPSPSSCSDYPSNWMSSEGDSCSVFQSYNYCTSNGAEGSGWKRSQWGPITNYADSSGYSAFDACCACGGGSTGIVV